MTQRFRLFDEISPKCTREFAEFVGKVADDDDILIEVMSYGGEVFSGLAIAQLIGETRARGIQSTAVIYGIAASAAAILSLACDHVIMTESGSLMLHGVWCDGGEDDEGIARANEACLSIIRRRCPDYSLETLTSGDNWYSAEEAKALGLIDEIRVLDDFGNDSTLVNSALALTGQILRAFACAQTDGGLKMSKKLKNDLDEKDIETQVEEQEEKVEELDADGEDIVVDDMDLKELIVDGFNAILERLAAIESQLASPAIEADGDDKDDDDKDDIMAAKIRAMYERIGKVSQPCAKPVRDEGDSKAEVKAAAERVKTVFPNIAKYYGE